MSWYKIPQIEKQINKLRDNKKKGQRHTIPSRRRNIHLHHGVGDDQSGKLGWEGKAVALEEGTLH